MNEFLLSALAINNVKNLWEREAKEVKEEETTWRLPKLKKETV